MDDILRLRLPDTKATRLVARSGSVSTIANLDMVSIETCKSAIILGLCDDTASAAEKVASDAMVIQTILRRPAGRRTTTTSRSSLRSTTPPIAKSWSPRSASTSSP